LLRWNYRKNFYKINKQLQLLIGGVTYGAIQIALEERHTSILLDMLKCNPLLHGSRNHAVKRNTKYSSTLKSEIVWVREIFSEGIRDCLGTRNILRRKTMILDSYDCELCNTDSEETLAHLFLTLTFCTFLLEPNTCTCTTPSNNF
jgi:hypothetical protein